MFGLTLTGRLHAAESAPQTVAGDRGRVATPGLLARVAIASLILGVGLLNIANANWAHAIGVASLLAFIVTAFLAIVPSALAGEESLRPPGSSGLPAKRRPGSN